MSRHIIILDHTRKESVGLGKILSNAEGFQMPARRIARFLVTRIGNNIELTDDSRNLPDDEEDGWVEVDSFHL